MIAPSGFSFWRDKMKLIPLTQGKVAMIDDCDYMWLSEFKWCYDNGYARRRASGRFIYMHREITKTPDGYDTDHRDGDKSNNQRANLRICTRAENKRNSSKNTNNTSG